MVDRRLRILTLWSLQDALHVALSEMHSFNLLEIFLLRLEIGNLFLDSWLTFVVCSGLSLRLEELLMRRII